MYSKAFPEPLTKEEETYYLKQYLSSGDPEAKNQLIEHNLRLVVYYSERYDAEYISREDLVSEGVLGLIRGIHTYDPGKSVKLSTYLGRCIDNAMISYARALLVQKKELPFEEMLQEREGNENVGYPKISGLAGEDTVFDRVAQKDMLERLGKNLKVLTKEQRELLELRYGIGGSKEHRISQRELAARWGLSQSYISRIEKKILRQLRNKLK